MAVWSTLLSTCVALQLNAHPQTALLSDKKVNETVATEWKVEMVMVAGCGRNPGAGMDPDEGFITIFKDGYFHVRCMMDEMHKIANYHNEQTRVHEYKVHTNVSIVKYEDRVDVEKQVKMTPRICFDFCRTIPDMNQFGLVYGRECYCTPYYHQVPGDGVCSSPCEGDNTVTCGNQDGMADIYEMHTCGDTVADAQKDTDALKELLEHYHEVAVNATHILHGLDETADSINVEEIRHPVLNATRELAGLIRPLKEANAEGEQASIASDDYLATVTEGTTNAHKVKHIEGMQKRCNDAASEMKKTGKLVEDWLKGMSSAAAMKAAGITKMSAQELGEKLNMFGALMTIDKFSDEDLSTVKDSLNCKDNLFDCEGTLRYYWWPSSYMTARDVNNGGYLRVSETVEPGSVDFNEFQLETVINCAQLCQDVEVCHFFYTYTSYEENHLDGDAYKYQYCGFYTLRDTENCESRYRSVYEYFPERYTGGPYYYSWSWYYYYYYYDEETSTGSYTPVTLVYYYSYEYDYTWYSASHSGVKNDYTDCIGPITYTNIEGITTGR